MSRPSAVPTPFFPAGQFMQLLASLAGCSPGPQLKHEVFPDTFCALPIAHSPHSALPNPASAVPGSQRSHAVFPVPAAKEPGRHEEQFTAPLPLLKRPASQRVQSANPRTDEKRPVEQLEHVVVFLPSLPRGHASHERCPWSPATVPATHASHSSNPTRELNCPLAHKAHCPPSAPAPSTMEERPKVQLSHWLAPVELTNFPLLQSEQTVNAGAGAWDPAAHASQPPTAHSLAEAVPVGHTVQEL
mmetsp:Transcript_17999/g.36900  ORF Transcript_17999/g.36900 Transcript_17999/m.36900 type:complete len:245 (+) Transcript_17999:335-1069(+)